MATVILPCCGITLTGEPGGGGVITSDLHDHVDGESCWQDAAVHGMESLILAHFCAGIDVATPAYLEGIETTLDAITNHEE